MTALGGNDHRFNAFMSYPLVATLTRAQGKHNWKYGGEVRLIRVNVWEARNAGQFNFNAGNDARPESERRQRFSVATASLHSCWGPARRGTC